MPQLLGQNPLTIGYRDIPLLQVMIWIADTRDFDAMNEVYDQWVPQGQQPVRACVESKLASPDLLIEVQASAALQ